MNTLLRLVFVSLLLPAIVLAQDLYVPEDLRDWQGWVLHDKEYRQCPFFFDRGATELDDYVCAWPGRLELRVDGKGGSFTQSWSVYAKEQWLRLPGDTNYWPHQVTANGRAVAVVLRDNAPSVLLPPGEYRLSGTFAWDERPGDLSLPWQTGLLSLTVDGKAVARPDRSSQGVFLGERGQESQARDSVSSNVYRLVRDDVPTRLTTRLQIQVSGSVREELFGPLLPDGFTPLTLNSQLPARLEPDGKLRLQVRPGSWEIEVTARAAGVLDAISLREPEANMPDAEIWSYAANDSLRVTAPDGSAPVDPSQVGTPGEWQQLPAFRLAAGESLQITERSRGIVSADNELHLSRSMWLAFDRSNFMVKDQIAGSMRSGWRLDMSPPFALLTASVAGENLLITDGVADGQTGVELRYPNLELAAVGRSEPAGPLPATGWDTRFSSVDTVLHLPPGHKLLAAPGVDTAGGSWASQWELLDFFLLLIIAIAAWRLFGPAAGVIALATLTLSFHELSAPTWLWLNLLISVALLRVAPAGRLRHGVLVYQLGSAVLLVLLLVPFIAGQLRIAIYPQLEAQWPAYAAPYDYDVAAESDNLQLPATAPARMDKELMDGVTRERMLSSPEEIVVTASKVVESSVFSRYAPDAIVQAGAGIPSWQWNTYRLSWSGPVDSEQTMRLMILPRWLVSLLRFAEVGLLLLFVGVFAAEILKREIRLPGGLRLGNTVAGSLAMIGLLTLSMLPDQAARAELPDAEILQELEARLLRAPECAPRCAELVAADIAIREHSVRMRLTIDALGDVAMPLPGTERGWHASAILLNGSAAGQVTRGPGQALWLRLLAGRHSVELEGAIPAVDSLEIPFPAPPRVVEASGDGWFVAGIKDRRLLSGSLQLTRLQTDTAAANTVRWESSRFPAFVEVSRTLQLDLDWRVTTTVTRVAPAQGALTLELPLLQGEAVISDNLSVRDGKVLVSMAPNQHAVSWTSNLERVSPLTLRAEDAAAWREQWSVVASNIWHTTFSGVPESEAGGVTGNARTAVFFPRAGEELSVTTTRPEGSAGSTLAFDSVALHTQHGDRSSDTTMSLEYRSTRGLQHVVQLPGNAEVTNVVIDGLAQSLRATDGQLILPILPGEHSVDVVWRSGGEAGSRIETPAVDIGAPASNISLQLELPRDRWLLGTSGPRLGPAVLYWSELAVLLLAAIILGKTNLAPLKTWQWLLLGLGFSTFDWPAFGWIVLWLLASGARARWHGTATWWRFNLVQVAIVALTIIALGSIVASLPGGLLGVPDMSVTGNGSYGNSLRWFADQSSAAVPQAAAFSVPLWVYKVLILGWSLWLSFALLRWLPWVWRSFSAQGYWRPRHVRTVAATGGKE